MTVSELSTDCPAGGAGGVYYMSRRETPHEKDRTSDERCNPQSEGLEV